MDTSCLRLRFTPLFKNLCKSDSKCCLEIVPEVSCVQNLDKIQWQHGDESIEYMIPITYKVILKKKYKKQVSNDDGQLKTYHSCVDLMVPSSIDVTSSDVIKVISDSVIFDKLTHNGEDKSDEKITSSPAQTSSDESQARGNKPKITNSVDITNKKKFYLKEIKDEGTQFCENSYNSNSYRLKKIYLKDKITSAPFAGDLDTVKYIRSSSADWEPSIASKEDRKLSITPICSINTQDNLPINYNEKTSNLIVLRVQDPKCYNANNTKYIAPKEKHGFKVIKEIKENKSYDSITDKSSERILPEVRVAQFMKTVEQDLMPLKNSLNEIIRRCALLGYICKENQNPMMFNYVPCIPGKDSFFKTESKSNRVVYSMVFDG